MKKIRTPIAATLYLVGAVISLFLVLVQPLFTVGIQAIVNTLSYTYITIISHVVDLVLAFTLFSKKRNNKLCIVLCCGVLVQLFVLIRQFSISALLFLVVNVLLLIFSLAVCEQTLVKTDMSKIKELACKYYFVPAIIALGAAAFNWSNVARLATLYGYAPSFTTVLSPVLEIVALFTFAKWLKDPYAANTVACDTTNDSAFAEDEYEEAYCGLGKHILLCLFTCGIWYLIWTYRTTKYLNKAPNAEHYNPTSKLLLCIFIPFYQIYWFYKHGQRIDAMSKQKKLNNSDMATMCLILGIFIPIVACILMQERINVLCTTKTVVKDEKENNSTIEEIKKYKELLDSGVISQEEFDAKKKQLLDL